MTVYLHASMKS